MMRGKIVLVPFRSTTDVALEPGHPDFEQTGLRVRSILRVHRLLTLSSTIIKRELGSLSPRQLLDPWAVVHLRRRSNSYDMSLAWYASSSTTFDNDLWDLSAVAFSALYTSSFRRSLAWTFRLPRGRPRLSPSTFMTAA